MSGEALVTGAWGFIGRHAARHLAGRGWRVQGIGHGDWGPLRGQEWGLSGWYPGDVTIANLKACGARPDLILHCAGGASVGASVQHPDRDHERTVGTTEAVLEFARIHAPAAAVVLPSSAAVYGSATDMPIHESAPLRPVSPYGEHKQMAENLCRLYARKHGLATAVVRLFSVYGPGLRKQLLWDACARLARGEPPDFFGDGTETRDWLHVEDAATLLDLAGTHAGRDCPVVNGGTGEDVSVRELLTQLFRLLGRDDLPRFAGIARSGDPKRYQADIRAARNWGWEPQMAWRDGLRQYVDWFRRGAA